MADAVIGALRVVLGADTAAFEDGLKKGSRQLSGFEAGVSKSVKALGAVFASIAIGFAASIKHMINEADKFNKASQKFGVPVEELSALAYAADLADVSFEALGTSLGKLAKNMSAVAGGAQNDAAKAFQVLSISVKNADGSLKSSSEVMGDVAEAFSGLEDGAAKTALAIAIFGKAGAQMIPLLNQGRAGLEKTTEEARQFGVVIDTKTAKSAEEFNDNLTRLGAVMRGVVIKVTADLVDDLEILSQSFVKVAGDASVLETVASVIGATIRGLTTIAIATGAAFAQMARDFRLVVEVAKNITSLEGIKNAFNEWQAASKAANEENNRTVETLLGMRQPVLDLMSDWASLAEVVNKNPLKPAPILDTDNALNKFIESTRKSIATQQAEVQAFGLSAGARERLRIQLEAVQIAQTNNIAITAKQKAEIDALGASAELTAQKLAGMARIQETLPLWEQFQLAVRKANDEIAALNPTLEQVDAVNRKVAEQFGLTWQQQSASIAGSLGDITSTFAGENKKLVATAKALHAAQALIAAYAGAAEALALPFPANLAASATVLAKGLALVAAIGAVGFAKGGSFTVPGGISGVDTTMVPLSLAAGERVDITPASEARGRGSGVQEITLRSPRMRDLFTEHVRDLVDVLNQAAPDGYILKVPA
jgi:hypothetical protein